jgi:murein DD-endopeptidase MepM/ murein hydrolase activator NlpD
LAALLVLWAGPAFAGMLQLEGPMVQGALIHGKTEPGAKITLDGRNVRVAKDGAFIFGFGRDAQPHASLDIEFKDGSKTHRDLSVRRQRYQIQRIESLPEKQVTPDPETLARIKHDQAAIAATHRIDSSNDGFRRPLKWPVTGPISGVYGSQRILNGEPRAPHLGTDIAAPEGTPIRAPATGTVSLAEPDFVLDGGTVVIDHGFGLATLYIHMSKLYVKKGQRIAAGQVIGEVGKTGRATGPHLHWGVYWYAIALDPVLAAGPMPGTQADQTPAAEAPGSARE